MPYNPFDKPLGQQLAAEDLQLLISRQVSEGYYVEFKGEFIPNDKIAKGISALANTYGGWFIIGVETDDHSVANQICGFSLSDIQDPIAKVREVIKSRIDPVPVFFPQVVEIGSGKAVLLTYVPEGQETPYRTIDGKIYRRIADSSDPVQETNRHAIDRLVDAGRNVQRGFERFCQDTRSFSKAENGQCWVSLFASPYPLGAFPQRAAVDCEHLRSILEASRRQVPVALGPDMSIQAGTVFTGIQPTHQSVILRITNPDTVSMNGLTVELFRDGRAKVHIPLQFVNVFGRGSTVKTGEIRSMVERIAKSDQSLEDMMCLRFFDLGALWINIAIVLNFYRVWLGDQPWLTDLRLAASIDGAWRTVPFMDHARWRSHIEVYGLPVVMTDTIQIPDPMGNGMLFDANNPSVWMAISGMLGLAFGLPTELQGESFAYTVAKHASNASANLSK